MPDSIDDRTLQAIATWLDLPRSSAADLGARIASSPLEFLSSHLDLLPSELLLPIASTLSPRQRGTLPRVRDRRRRFVAASPPEELSWASARNRYPSLFRSLGCEREAARSAAAAQGASYSERREASQSSRRGGGQTADQDAPGPSTRPEYTPTHPEDVMDLPRFQAMLSRQDAGGAGPGEEEEEEVEEEEENESEHDDDDDDDEAFVDERRARSDPLGAFEDEVKRRFVRGDRKVPPWLYACDVDDAWDAEAEAREAGRDRGGRRQEGRNVGITEEDAWFDGEEAS